MQFDEARWREDDQHIFHYIAGDASLWMRRYDDFSSVPPDVLQQLGTLEFMAAIPIEKMSELPIVRKGVLDLAQLLRTGYAVTVLPADAPFDLLLVNDRHQGQDH